MAFITIQSELRMQACPYLSLMEVDKQAAWLSYRLNKMSTKRKVEGFAEFEELHLG